MSYDQALIDVLISQRNQANNRSASLEAMIVVLRKELEELKEKNKPEECASEEESTSDDTSN